MRHILDLIEELAIYENELASVEATEEKLLTTLGFNPQQPGPAYAKTLLLFSSDGGGTVPSLIIVPLAKLISFFHMLVSPVGMALYFYSYSTWRAAPGIWLEDLYVREKYRGRGYGTALITALASEVEKINGGRLEWSVLKWNTPSIKF